MWMNDGTHCHALFFFDKIDVFDFVVNTTEKVKKIFGKNLNKIVQTSYLIRFFFSVK